MQSQKSQTRPDGVAHLIKQGIGQGVRPESQQAGYQSMAPDDPKHNEAAESIKRHQPPFPWSGGRRPFRGQLAFHNFWCFRNGG